MVMPYIWAIPNGYPQRVVGLYDKTNPLHYLTLLEGVPLKGEIPPLRIRFDDAKLRDLERYDSLWNNSGVPLVSNRLAQLMLELGREDFELIDAEAVAADGTTRSYRLVNITNLVDSIDYSRSLPVYITNTSGGIMGFNRLVFRQRCMDLHAFGREIKKRSMLLVSSLARDELMRQRLRGVEFVTADEFFPPSGAAHRGSSARH
jgi:hypothetical protein